MVLQSIMFGLASGIGLGISDVIAAGVTRRMGVVRSALAFQIVTVSVYSLYLLTGTGIGSISGPDWAIMAALSVLVLIFYLSFYKALQLGPVSVVGPILAAHSVIVVLMSVALLGERLSGWQFVSIFATIGGVALMSMDVRSFKSGQKILGYGIGLALVATVTVGVWQFSIGVLSRDFGWFLPLYLSRVFLLSMLMPLSVWRRSWPWQGITWPVGAAVVVVAVLESGALFAFSRGAEIGIISIVAAASTVYPVIPVLGGFFLFRERLAPNQLVGLLVVVIGLVGLAVIR